MESTSERARKAQTLADEITAKLKKPHELEILGLSERGIIVSGANPDLVILSTVGR